MLARSHWRIHIAEMIRNENVIAIRCDLLQTFHFHLHSAAPQKEARPLARHCDLLASVVLEKRNHPAHQSESDGGKYDQWSCDEVRAEKRHWFYFTSSARASPAR